MTSSFSPSSPEPRFLVTFRGNVEREMTKTAVDIIERLVQKCQKDGTNQPLRFEDGSMVMIRDFISAQPLKPAAQPTQEPYPSIRDRLKTMTTDHPGWRDFWLEYMRWNFERLKKGQRWVFVGPDLVECTAQEMREWVQSGHVTVSDDIWLAAPSLFDTQPVDVGSESTNFERSHQ